MPRSRKSLGGPREDILDDVGGEPVLVGDRREAFALTPELDQVLDVHLRLGEDWRAPTRTKGR